MFPVSTRLLQSIDAIRRSRFLLVVVLLALLLRVGFVLVMGDTSDPRRYYEFGLIAQNMAEGAGFSMHWWYQTGDSLRLAAQQLPPAFEGAFMPPMNPAIVYLGFLVFGVNTPQAAMALMLFYALIGAMTPVALYFTTRRFASERAARIAAIGLALFPPTLFAVTTFSGSVLFQTGALMAMTLAIGAASAPSPKKFALLGLVCGLMSFLRSEFFMLGLLIIAATTLLAVLRRGKGVLGIGAVAALVMMAVVAPWTWRNYTIFGRFLPVISHPWGEIWRGNNTFAQASSFDADGESNWFLKPHYRPVIARLDSLPYDGRFELAADSIFRQEVLAFVSENPGRALSLAVQRVILLWTIDRNHTMARHPLYIAVTIPTLLLILAGFVMTLRRSRTSGEWAPVVLYGLFFAFTSAIVATTHVQPRHQVYLVTVAFPFVGISLERLLAGRREGERAESSAKAIA